MATLQKFKLLATHCGVAASPARNPTTSPLVHLRRRRKTLRMLLGRGHRREEPPDRRIAPEKPEKITVRRHKLKDLFIASPPPLIGDCEKQIAHVEIQSLLPDPELNGHGFDGARGSAASNRIGAAAMRPWSMTLRRRLLRRAWRPDLGAIPEQSP